MRRIFNNQNQQDEFVKKGYTKTPAITADEVDFLLQELNKLHPQDNFSPGGAGAFELTHHVSFLDSNVQYKTDARKLIYKVFNPYLEKILDNYQILNCNFHIKPPNKGNFPIHLNWHHTKNIHDTTVSIWCPLVDVDENNGTIELVEGSHKIIDEISGPTITPYFRGFEDALLKKYLTAHSLKAGECMVFDDSLIHWSAENKSDSARIAIQILCIPKEETPIFYFWDANAAEKGFELFEVTADFFLQNTISDLFTRPVGWKSLGFVENKNQPLTEVEFVELLKNGDQIRQKIYNG